MSEPIVLQVECSEPERLDRYLQREMTGKTPVPLSRSQLKNLVDRGAVWVDGSPATKAGVMVSEGSTVEVDLPEQEVGNFEHFHAELDILYEDDSLVVIDKPAGIPMHPGAGNRGRTIMNALITRATLRAEEFQHWQRPGIVHRLDQDTTGIVVVAKNVHAHAELARQFAERSVSRTYLALALSTPRGKREIDRNEEGTVSGLIGRDPKNRIRMAVLEDRGKGAVTHWKVRERMLYGVLLEIRLETGRTHQIRVHLDSIASPIVGDPVYGNFSALPKEYRRSADAFGRQALHACSLGFTHPSTSEQLSFASHPPADMLSLIELFRDGDPSGL